MSTALSISNNSAANAVAATKDALAFLRRNALPVSDALVNAVARLDAPHYKVGFVGRFQVGKSTLINKAFLEGDVLLKEGHGLCTTAVATEIHYAAAPQLVVVPAAGIPAAGTAAGTAVLPPVPPKPAPTAEDIAAITAVSFADTDTREAARTALAAKTEIVKIGQPAEILKRFTLVDTPGIDDPNTALLSKTTYRLLPTFDTAILVVEPTQLSEIELNFLRDRVFSDGFARILVLVSYKPNALRSRTEREAIVSTIKAQLANIGRENIPVEIYCFDPSVEGTLNTPHAIRATIVAFLENNLAPARAERANFIALRELQLAKNQITLQLSLAEKNDGERTAALAVIEEQANAAKKKYDVIRQQLSNDIERLKQHAITKLQGRLLEETEEYCAGFEKCEDISALELRIKNAAELLRPRLSDAVFDINKDVLAQLNNILKTRAKDLPQIADLPAPAVEFNIEKSFLYDIPEKLIIIADYVITIFILPGSPLINILKRFFLTQIPIFKELTITEVIKTLLENKFKNDIRKAVENQKPEFDKLFNQIFSEIGVQLDTQLTERFSSEVAAIRETAERTCATPISSAEIAKLKTLASEISTLEKRLGA
jgi:hypothetical protein